MFNRMLAWHVNAAVLLCKGEQRISTLPAITLFPVRPDILDCSLVGAWFAKIDVLF
jgi:hypothetical protein